MPFPVTIVASGGIAVTNSTSGFPATPITAGGVAITLVVSGGLPMALVNEDLSAWSDTPAAPVNTVAPVISGTATTGQTLTSTTGTWTGNPAPTYAYQWKNAGVNLGGATSSTYVLQATDEGDNITCTVTATNSEGNASATSNTIVPTAPGSSAGEPMGLLLTLTKAA